MATVSTLSKPKAAPRRSTWLIKLRSWEYWPFFIVYFPIFLYWAWLSLRARSFFFFTAANPTIEFGGMRGESKIGLYHLVPKEVQPITRYQEPGKDPQALLDDIAAAGITYPLIVKPDVGERGTLVEKIDDQQALLHYHSHMRVPYLVQEYIDWTVELGLFYFRYPGQKTGTISSIVYKDLLSITGDGEHTLGQLLQQNDRASLQEAVMRERFAQHWDDVLPFGESLLLMPIGNHCRGTAFLNGADWINDSLREVFDKLSDQIDGFHFGRFDLRCESIEALSEGRNFKILELNGAGAEPGHIYQPGYSLWQAWKDIIYHLDQLCNISIANHKRGVPYYSFGQGIRFIRQINAYYRKMEGKA